MEPQPQKKNRGLVKLVLSLVLFGLAAWLFVNRQTIIDQIAYMQYKPTAEVAALSQRAALSDRGKFYLYVSQPEIQDREGFNKACNTLRSNETVVLGCYAARRIHIFNVTDERLDGIREVTAAHEMLHAAYDRLSVDERKRVDGLLNTAAANIADENIKTLLREYDKTEPGERLNELHSILGTQVNDLGTDLETYYSQYFANRKATVALSQKYESVFNSLKTQQDQLARELEALAAELTNESAAFNQSVTQLNADIESFNARAESDGFSTQSQFDSERDALIARQAQLRSRQEALGAKIALYNEKRKELESINSEAEALNRSINSNLSPVPSL